MMIVSGWKLSAWMPASKPLLASLVLEVVVFGEQFLDAVDEELLGADDEDLVPALLLRARPAACRVP